jgi:hypothetical protein
MNLPGYMSSHPQKIALFIFSPVVKSNPINNDNIFMYAVVRCVILTSHKSGVGIAQSL